MGEPNTRMTDAWIMQALDANPAKVLESGNIMTPPCRLSFPHLFKPQDPLEPGGKAKYTATLLFNFFTDLDILKQAASATAKGKWPDAFTDAGPKLHNPFVDQKEKAKFDGYVPGSLFITATSERRPAVVDTKMVPIVDEREVYPGCWVIAFVRPFPFDVRLKKGVSFGLQHLMKIADDNELGGGGGDPTKDFASVKGFDGMSNATNPAASF